MLISTRQSHRNHQAHQFTEIEVGVKIFLPFLNEEARKQLFFFNVGWGNFVIYYCCYFSMDTRKWYFSKPRRVSPIPGPSVLIPATPTDISSL